MPQAKVKELTEYLGINSTINGLCFIPINMVILVYLYKLGIPLPRNSTQLYNHFICLTICRCLAKAGCPLDNTITDLTNLPDYCATVVKQLSKLSFEALNDNKLIFKLKEIEEACPDIAAIPGAINGFGLLQAVQQYGLTGTTTTFNFIHFSIQEFLAAYHITQLPPHEQLQALKAMFWSELHSNMFAMYTSLTKGQSSAFKQFISDENGSVMISEIFLRNQLKCLRLFHCFHEAGDKAYFKIIESAKTFDKKVISLGSILLSPNDLECVVLFLNCSSRKEWTKLDLSWCSIQDNGLHLLHHGLAACSNISIKILDLRFNSLTQSSSSLVSALTIHFGVEVLVISYNYTIGENHALYEMLSNPSSRLVKLHMQNTRLSSTAANTLFVAIAMGKKLQYLDICVNEITDDSCEVIASALEHTSLVQFRMDHNRISDAAKCIVEALHFNDTLEKLWLPVYNKDIKQQIRLVEREIIQNREIRGCQTKLKIKL
ncbi:protein NLRC5-like [Dysidea avara]|uniref:protein NLRC5-like n=1 Tax=Dysidea avara TaxID=196820 RepID=UPI003327A906